MFYKKISKSYDLKKETYQIRKLEDKSKKSKMIESNELFIGYSHMIVTMLTRSNYFNQPCLYINLDQISVTVIDSRTKL